ncbi:MAG: hypothetical protein ACPGGK_18445 [Pikeienuella sp.]
MIRIAHILALLALLIIAACAAPDQAPPVRSPLCNEEPDSGIGGTGVTTETSNETDCEMHEN